MVEIADGCLQQKYKDTYSFRKLKVQKRTVYYFNYYQSTEVTKNDMYRRL